MTMNSGARGAPRVPTLPTGEQVATYGTYLEAQHAVGGLRLFERVHAVGGGQHVEAGAFKKWNQAAGDGLHGRLRADPCL